MVICYTNHALDQFTEDLMDIGIPNAAIVRLGSKSSPRTEGLLLHRQRVKTSLSRSAWCEIKDAEADMISRGENMRGLLQKLSRSVSTDEILSYLEFHDDTEYYDAFEVPIHSNGMSTVGRKGKAIKPDYLLRRWLAGAQDVGPFSKGVFGTSSAVWLMPNDRRRALYNEWEAQIRKQKLDDLQSAGAQYNMRQAEIRNRFKEGDAQLLANKRIIACTSTYAAMSIDILRRVRPETVMLEEAGELLEPHVLTAIHDSTQRIIMIGDHKQLRPKIMNYALSVECGQGFDLNRSLFERLLLRGLPHVTLNQQHRMRPEIAGIVRHLTYPQLEDAPSTRTRPNVRGLQQNVVFVDHREPEDTLEGVTDRNASVSKQNQYEATLALRFVKYLCQQGYTSEDIVVLTPYLGQLRKLRQTLSTENDPVLNDPDSHDLFAAGLLNSAPSASGGPRIRLSSIDNYQGEEKSIVIISLTRSNSTGDIGFMSQPERLNVLLSRARDGLIVIGNISTFTASKKGGELWSSLQKHMAERKWILRGLPIQCQSHPDVKNIAVKPDDFATMCPDGGCSQLCQEMLSCKTHKCPSRCHILVDHSKIRCPEVIKHTCPKGHSTSYLCQTKPPSDCITCKTLDEKRQRRAKNQLEKFKMQEAEQRRHDQEMEALDEEIALMRKEMANMSLKQEQSIALAAKLQDREAVQKRLEIAKKRAMNATATAPRNGQQSSNVKGTPGFSGTKNEHQSSKQQQQASDQESAEVSPSREEWLRQKRVEGQKNDALDQLVDMVGLENVKQYILDTKGQIEVKKRQNVLSGGERYHASFLGNPGTGKTTVARLWAKLLYTLEVLPGDVFEETTGSKLATGGIQSMQKHIATIVAGNGGVMFIDEAYQLTSGTSAGGRQVLDFLLAEIENQRDKVVFIFAGYRQQMETFYSHNPGIPSRIPHRLDFCDYSEAELLLMLQKLFKKRFNDNAKIEDGNKGLFMRIAARRLSRRRGQEGFGNMRDLENLFGGICARQASRISRERRQGSIPDDFVFEKEDLIGPEPSSALLQSAAWKKLHSLIGLATVKQSISSLVAVLKTNYHRELEEKEPIQVSLNKVFLGPPGTGKTSVAKLYGRLLADIGLLTKGDVLEKTPTDFIGAALGASEQATSGILESAKGKVLIIDEAYMLNPTQSSGQTATDPYRSAVIDTIVSKVHNVPGDDQCVILLGYEEEMEAMFQNSNPGFTRRFPLASAFRFNSFTPDELHQILRLKLAEEDLTVTEQGEHTAMDVLSRARNLSNFGNAGEVSNVIGKAKLSWQKRMTDAVDMVQDLDSIDFDPDFARADTASIRLQNLFQDSIGHHHLVDQLRQYQLIAANLKAKGLPVEDHVPFNFIFKGPSGTGKTTTARKIGQVYYDMGLLDKVEVVECSVSDLVAEYVGQTGPKTRKQLERGLGKVLLVDEAYRLNEGHFATEAVNELTDLLTKPKFKGKVITILAGYENEMNTMLAVNPGLASRFSETIHFTSLSPQQCVELFTSRLRSHGLSCRELDDSQSSGHQEISEVFEDLTKLKHWGNGRDIGNLSSKAMRFALGREIKEGEDAYELPCSYVLDVLKRELLARQKMEGTTCSTNAFDGTTSPEAYQQITNSAPPPSTMTVQQIVTEQEPEPDELAEETTESSRDAGVSDATWNQLQADIAAATQRQLSDSRALQTLAAEVTDCHNTLEQASLELAQREQAIEEHPSSGDGGDSDSEEAKAAAEKRRQLLKQLERARLRKAEMARQRALAEEKAAREKERQAQEREKEAVAQKKLKRTGVCPVGYQWIRQSNGYICAGGSHFVSHAQLDSIS
ncbi:MAG: hypothetical protein M1822_002551 [Bathelium mastoideum]|nr:MAG: hypothetical protein M1822_002551 [Bathelium mastoideum]